MPAGTMTACLDFGPAERNAAFPAQSIQRMRPTCYIRRMSRSDFTAGALLVLLLLARPAAADLDLSAMVSEPGAEGVSREQQLAHAGDIDAQFRLAQRYDTGNGVSQNYTEAFRWYRLAAEQGHVEAQLNVGLMYNEGQGVTQDPAAGAEWLRRAADAGNADAQYTLGLMYYHGNGLPRDFTMAREWYRRAAAGGSAKAMNNLGIMHGLGEGVAQDDLLAFAWFSLAAERGDSNAEKNRDLTAKEMSQPKLEAAMQRKLDLAAELGL